jgi:hypothetical protein
MNYLNLSPSFRTHNFAVDSQFSAPAWGCFLEDFLGKGSMLSSSVQGHYLFHVIPGFLEWRYRVAMFAYVAVTGIVCSQG